MNAVAEVRPKSVLIDMASRAKVRPDLSRRNKASAHGFDNQYIPEPNSGCWIWIGALTARGYGHSIVDGKTIPAHRKSWLINCGPIDDELHVLHRCDVRCCVNPNHLFLGTNQDNVDDKMGKGRHVAFPGETNGNAKLTEDDIRSIRVDLRPNTVIAEELGVSNVLISKIKRNLAWRHVQ